MAVWGTKPYSIDSSLDALQVVVAVQAHFGVRLQGDRMVCKRR